MRCGSRLSNKLYVLVIAGVAVTTAASRADVIDIAADGSTTLYAQPAALNQANTASFNRSLPGGRRSAPSTVSNLIVAAAHRYAIDDGLLASVAWQESGYNNSAISPKGAVGIMQLMPQTAHDLGVNPFDLAQNIFGGAAYLHQMLTRYNGDPTLALAAYNAGPGAVDRFGGLPPFAETQAYVHRILGNVITSGNPSVFVFNL